MPPLDIPELEAKARAIRRDIVRMVGAAGSGHPGGSLSAADLIAALYFRVLRHRPEDPHWPDRDRFILSKGHGCPALYGALAEAGYIPRDLLTTLRKFGSPLQGHPDRRKLPVLEASTGSLGQGLSLGIGMALAARMDRRDYRTWVLLGDGELNEGQVWEAAMFAAFHKVDNLTAIVDANRQQLDDWTHVVLDMGPVADKFRSFGWQVAEIDGHDMRLVVETLEATRAIRGKPSLVLAHTIKGKGVSFMENNLKFHGVAPTAAEVEQALKELA
jgi:transketolase